MAGFTHSWFWGMDSVSGALTAGTIRVGKPNLTAVQKKGDCTELTWSIANTGSKRSFIRVKPIIEGEVEKGYSAWLEGKWIGDNWFGQYFEYKKGDLSEESPKTTNIVQGDELNVMGQAQIWDDGERLYVRYIMNAGVSIIKTHFYVGFAIPDITSPGQYPIHQDVFQHPLYQFSSSVVYEECRKNSPTHDFASLAAGTKLYIAGHIDGVAASGSGFSIKTNLIPGADGWYYYGDSQGPYQVDSGATIQVTFTVCPAINMTVQLEAESVQVTNDAINFVWPDNPWSEEGG